MNKLEVIFQGIILSSFMASVLICIILTVKHVLKNKISASLQYYFWFLLILRLIVPYTPESMISIFNIVKPEIINISADNNFSSSIYENAVVKESQEQKQVKVTNVILPKENLNETKQKSEYFNLTYVLMMLWFAGAAAFTAYTIRLNLKFKSKLAAKYYFADEKINNIFMECKSLMNIRSSIPIILTASINTPSLIGINKPRLLLPEEVSAKVSDAQLKHIFLHELAHFKRKDILVNWIITILQILHWFNPIVWYGFYRMRNDCEIACDALAISYLSRKEHKEYGNTILYLLKVISTPQWIPGAAGILKGKSLIKRRIVMISKFKKSSVWWKLVAVLLFAAIGIVTLTNVKGEDKNKIVLKGKNSTVQNKAAADKGEGVVITLSEKDPPITSSAWGRRIRVSDIEMIVKALREAGAENISINDEPLNENSKIEENTALILNNDRMLKPPLNKIIRTEFDIHKKFNYTCTIKALGNSEMLEKKLQSGDSIINGLMGSGMGVEIEKIEGKNQ